MRVLIISTTTNEGKSSSRVLCGVLSKFLKYLKHEIMFVDANRLHIVKNLSCYAEGKKNCSNPVAGPYRCWAHFHSEQNPEKYGGRDEMPVIYDGIDWADVVVFATSVRWGSHSALLQTVIERMNTLENRSSVYGERNPLSNKHCGVIVTGQHWRSREVAERLIDIFSALGFSINAESSLSWQNVEDPHVQQEGSNAPIVLQDMKDAQYIPMIKFIKGLKLV